ncbi:hypothetical protein J6590_029061 [Homalodisca vitripennis]|nr:hypothetical protein J6590_029061 [Homalodisca vitripennis]
MRHRRRHAYQVIRRRINKARLLAFHHCGRPRAYLLEVNEEVTPRGTVSRDKPILRSDEFKSRICELAGNVRMQGQFSPPNQTLIIDSNHYIPVTVGLYHNRRPLLSDKVSISTHPLRGTQVPYKA